MERQHERLVVHCTATLQENLDYPLKQTILNST